MIERLKSDDTLVWIIGIGLLLFTGYRSLHLVSSTLPSDAQILAFAALAALDLGCLAWLRFANGGARERQRGIALLMVVVDLCGVAAAVIADTALIGAPDASRGLIGMVSLWVVPIVIIANIAATIAVAIFDPERARRDAERARAERLARAREDANDALDAATREAEVESLRRATALQRMRNAQAFSENSNGHAGTADVEMAAEGAPVPKGKRR